MMVFSHHIFEPFKGKKKYDPQLICPNAFSLEESIFSSYEYGNKLRDKCEKLALDKFKNRRSYLHPNIQTLHQLHILDDPV